MTIFFCANWHQLTPIHHRQSLMPNPEKSHLYRGDKSISIYKRVQHLILAIINDQSGHRGHSKVICHWSNFGILATLAMVMVWCAIAYWFPRLFILISRAYHHKCRRAQFQRLMATYQRAGLSTIPLIVAYF